MTYRSIITHLSSFLLIMLMFAPPTLADQKPAAKKQVLFILTSHIDLNGTGKKTGTWFDALATPYYALEEAGYDVALASISGLSAPIDPESEKYPTAATERFLKDKEAMAKLDDTIPVTSVKAAQYDAMYLPGGHGVMWDFVDNANLRDLLVNFVAKDHKILAALDHGAIGFIGVTDAKGKSILKGRKIAAATKAEEGEQNLIGIMPVYADYSLEDAGAKVVRVAPFQPNAVQDDYVITGQNPQSVEKFTKLLLAALQKMDK